MRMTTRVRMAEIGEPTHEEPLEVPIPTREKPIKEPSPPIKPAKEPVPA
jgi:hypothetical protein